MDDVEAGAGAAAVDTDNDGIPDCLDLDSYNDCVPDSVDAFSARINAVVPAQDADAHCPASAPACDVTVGRCVLQEKAYSTETVVLQGSGHTLGCSSTGGAGPVSFGKAHEEVQGRWWRRCPRRACGSPPRRGSSGPFPQGRSVARVDGCRASPVGRWG